MSVLPQGWTKNVCSESEFKDLLSNKFQNVSISEVNYFTVYTSQNKSKFICVNDLSRYLNNMGVDSCPQPDNLQESVSNLTQDWTEKRCSTSELNNLLSLHYEDDSHPEENSFTIFTLQDGNVLVSIKDIYTFLNMVNIEGTMETDSIEPATQQKEDCREKNITTNTDDPTICGEKNMVTDEASFTRKVKKEECPNCNETFTDTIALNYHCTSCWQNTM